MKIKTPFVLTENTRTPKFLIDYQNKIFSYSACDRNDESIYEIEADQATIDLILRNNNYEVVG